MKQIRNQYDYGSSHWEPATASWSWRVSQPKAEREEFEGGVARAAVDGGGPGRLTFVAHSSKIEWHRTPGAAPGAVGARFGQNRAFLHKHYVLVRHQFCERERCSARRKAAVV